MRVLKSNYKVGNKVLFLWNQIPYTGIIFSIGTTSYGISPDADFYETDKSMIPRLHDEVFIPKSLCKHTGEIYIGKIENSPYRRRYEYRFGDDVQRAYEMLPKRTIDPKMAWDKDQFIEFIPNKMFFKTKDNKMYYYCASYSLLPLLRTENGIIAKPKWLYQTPEKNGDIGYEIISEEDILEIYEMNSYVDGVYPWDAYHYGHVDIIYDKNATTRRLTDENFSPDMERPNVDMDKVPDDYVNIPKI